MSQLSLFLLTCALSLAGQVNGRSSMSVAILHLRNYSKYARICASFQNTPGQSTFPTTLSQSEENPIVIIPPTEGCDVRKAPHNATAATSKHAVFFWTGGNCSFLDRMKQAKEWGAKQVIFIILRDTIHSHFRFSPKIANLSKCMRQSIDLFLLR